MQCGEARRKIDHSFNRIMHGSGLARQTVPARAQRPAV